MSLAEFPTPRSVRAIYSALPNRSQRSITILRHSTCGHQTSIINRFTIGHATGSSSCHGPPSLHHPLCHSCNESNFFLGHPGNVMGGIPLVVAMTSSASRRSRSLSRLWSVWFCQGIARYETGCLRSRLARAMFGRNRSPHR